MSRRHSAEKREIIPDAKFGDIVIAKFMNTIMYEGKKSVAEASSTARSTASSAKAKTDPLDIFKQALENVRRRSKCARAASAARPIKCR